MTFESVHDIAYPIKALQEMREMLASRGTVLVGDVKMKDVLGRKMILQADFIIILVCCSVFHNLWLILTPKQQEQL